MATSAKGAQKPADPTVPQGSKKKIFIIAGMIAVVALAGGLGFFFANKGKSQDAHEEQAIPPRPPVFIALQATPFLSNLKAENPQCNNHGKTDESVNCVEQYIQVAISLKYYESTLEPKIKLNLPEINSKILQILASRTARELLSSEGKAKLSRDIVQMCNTILGIAPATPPVVAAPAAHQAPQIEGDQHAVAASAPVIPAAVTPSRPQHESKGIVDALFTSFIIQ